MVLNLFAVLAATALCCPALATAATTAADLAGAGAECLPALQAKLAESGRARIRSLATEENLSDVALEAVVDTLVLDRRRLAQDSLFRARVAGSISEALPEETPVELRDRLLDRLSHAFGPDLMSLETIEAAWGAIARTSAERRVVIASPGDPPSAQGSLTWDDLALTPSERRIGLSIYSLASPFFGHAQATEFLAAVRRWAPERSIAVLVDSEQERQLAATADELEVHLVRTLARSYSPWPRDPMSFLTAPDGSRVAVLRPNLQRGRELDSQMGLELIQDLPDSLDARFGPIRWSPAPVPFHNGNILPTTDRTWISIHSLEPRILELLGLSRVPVESFGSPAGVQRYVAAALRAAGEFEWLFGNPVEFVHPLPGTEDEGLETAMRLLGGGAGFDLDSVLTLVDGAEAGATALVGQLAAGAELIEASSIASLELLRASYGLGPSAEGLRVRIAAAQGSTRAAGLDRFLARVAAHLAERGFTVRRIPLLLIPTELLSRSEDYTDDAFLLGWNNVVLETRDGRRRAEGFASLLSAGDSQARQTFAELGYELELLPPLIESVLRNGGYRCASNHIRDAE